MAEESTLNVDVAEGITAVRFKDASILDVTTIQRIGHELYEIVEDRSATKMILDFQDVRFLSSQALGVLLTVRRKAEKTGAKVVLAGIRPELRRVFKITNFDTLFEFYDTRDDARARLADG